MIECVIVTTWNREELLYLCLEAIRNQDKDIPISVWSDKGSNSLDLRRTCEHWRAAWHVRGNHSYYGNSFNLLQAMMIESHKTDIVHAIEDDTIIHPGYLDWARAQLSIAEDGSGNPEGPRKYAAVCGRIGSPHIPYWYESPCASWNSPYLIKALGRVADSYFSSDRKEMQRILDEKIFPNSRYKKGGAEQDGFFLRCIEHFGWKTCFPPKPMATHLGAWGYNMPPGHQRPEGSFVERLQWCRSLLKDREKRNALFGHGITAKEMGAWTP